MRKPVMKLALRYAMLLTYIMLFFPKPAYAYLDPGSGSYVIQMLIALGFGLAVGIKAGWHRIKALITGIFSKGKQGEDESG